MKQKVVAYYKQLVQDRIDVYQDLIESLTADAQNDAKSSAGDKHETALSMMQLEQEKLNYKLLEAITHLKALAAIDSQKKHTVIGIGSLVKVNDLTLLISVALPKINIDNQTVFAVSPNSPLVQQLMGKSVAHQFELNGKDYKVHSVE